jgi:hypothetical protein
LMQSENGRHFYEGLNPKRWKIYYAYPRLTADQQWCIAKGNTAGKTHEKVLIIK